METWCSGNTEGNDSGNDNTGGDNSGNNGNSGGGSCSSKPEEKPLEQRSYLACRERTNRNMPTKISKNGIKIWSEKRSNSKRKQKRKKYG